MSFPETTFPLWSGRGSAEALQGGAQARRRSHPTHSACARIRRVARRAMRCCCCRRGQAARAFETQVPHRWPENHSDSGRIDEPGGLAALLAEAGLDFERTSGGVSEADQIIAGVAQLLYQLMRQGESKREEECEAPRGPGSASPLSCSIQCGRLTPDDFHEELFEDRHGDLGYRVRLFRNLAKRSSRRRAISVARIHTLLRAIVAAFAFRREISILTVIYIERLLEKNSSLHLTSNNWRPILIAGLHVAMKTWEDVHPWNAEFSRYLRHVTGICLSARGLHILELRFLVGLEYRVDVAGALYAAYYFSLLDSVRPATPPEPSALEGDRPRAQSDDVLPLGSSLQCHDGGESCFLGGHGSFGGIMFASATEGDTHWARSVSDRSCHDCGTGGSWRIPDGHRTQVEKLRLDRRCPYVGSLRHAPRAAPPSYCIPSRQARAQSAIEASSSATQHVTLFRSLPT